MPSVHAQLLAAVERSPAAAAAYDRTGWVGLFTADGRIEDPVGSVPHEGTDEIGRFFDTFIAPRRIVFHRDLDIVSGNSVIRDLTLEVGMGTAVTMRIPAMLRYDLQSVEGSWRIERLRAYWELPAMMLRFLGSGLAAGSQALALASSLLRNQGLSGAAGFAVGFRGARLRGKRTVGAFLEAVSSGDLLGATRYLAQGAVISRGATPGAAHGPEVLPLRELCNELERCCWPKVIAAGSTIAVSIRNASTGVLFVETAQHGRAICALTYFTVQ